MQPHNVESIEESILNGDWEFTDADTKYLTHNIHRYSGKFIPQIASRAIKLLTQPGDLIVDPYCGSGTTLVECAQLGRRGIGVDLSPLAVLIAKVKTTPISKIALDDMVKRLVKLLAETALADEMPLFASNLSKNSEDVLLDYRNRNEWYCKWFQSHVLSDLIQIDLEIAKLPDESFRNLARVALSDILRRFSNAHSGYPNVMFDKNSPEKTRPIRAFFKSLERISEMVATLSASVARWEDVQIVHGDATMLPMEDSSIDAIVTHPPYIGSIPYAEYGALSLRWLGKDPKQLDRELTGGRRQAPDVVARFEAGYGKMLSEVGRVLKPGRHAFLMVGNPVVRGEVIDLGEMTVALANDAGLKVVANTERRGINRRANKMGAEKLLFFRKVEN